MSIVTDSWWFTTSTGKTKEKLKEEILKKNV